MSDDNVTPEDQIIPGTEVKAEPVEESNVVEIAPKTRAKRASAADKPVAQVASVGRIVHYTNTAEDARAAIIAEVWAGDESGTVDLVIFNSLGSIFAEDIPFSEEPKAEHWSWPPRD